MLGSSHFFRFGRICRRNIPLTIVWCPPESACVCDHVAAAGAEEARRSPSPGARSQTRGCEEAAGEAGRCRDTLADTNTGLVLTIEQLAVSHQIVYHETWAHFQHVWRRPAPACLQARCGPHDGSWCPVFSIVTSCQPSPASQPVSPNTVLKQRMVAKYKAPSKNTFFLL